MTTGVVVMSYGTPRSADELEQYYTHIRRGRPPEREQLDELRARYDAIGGTSPLRERTEAQRAAIARALDTSAPDAFVVVHGQKHAPPFIEDAVRELRDARVTSVVGLVLAPHYSRGSVGEYHERARAAIGDVPYVAIDRWYDEPTFAEFQAQALTETLAAMPPRSVVLFTAHSLPERVLDGDPYPDELRAGAEAIAARAGLDRASWDVAWQSAGRTPEPWRGPDVLEVVRSIGDRGDADGVVVCPHGFTADHLEVLYDLDVDCRRVAAEAGLAFARTRSLNDDVAVMAALADCIHRAAGCGS